MERRVFLWLLLSLGFLVTWQALFPPPVSEGTASPPAATDAADGLAPPDERGPVARSGPEPPVVDQVPEDATDASERVERIHGRGFDFEVRSLGATIGRLWLDGYSKEVGGEERLELFGSIAPDEGSLAVRDFFGDVPLDRVHWAMEPTADGGWRCTYTHGDGIEYRKTFRPGDDEYLVHVDLEVVNAAAEPGRSLSLVLEGAQGVVEEDTGTNWYNVPKAVAILREAGELDAQTWAVSDIDADSQRTLARDERLVAAGTMTAYFAALLVPGEDVGVRRLAPVPLVNHVKLEEAIEEKAPLDETRRARLRLELAEDHRSNARVDLQVSTTLPEVGGSARFAFDLFAGPKDPDLVEGDGYAFLGPAIDEDHGKRFRWINRTLLSTLRAFHGVVGNWGVAIILLTLLVRLLLFPLSRMQQSSMARYQAVMQKLKPELDALKEKYKNNQKKYNEEQFKMLREHGATPPLGGCLLMFVQLPIWIGLFQLLGTSIELRQAPFALWIQDLSRPDRMPFGLFGLETINLVPLLMAAATIVQMRFQPKPADPQQAQTQKIMAVMMPIMMLFLLYRYASGLSLYMFTSALLGIFEYRVIRKLWPVPGATPPAKAA